MASGPDLILASASPRRRELLERMGLRVHLEPANIDESVQAGEAPRDYVVRVAAEKCAAVAVRQNPWTIPVLAADTSVILGREILGKPEDEAAARAMLSKLSGRRHEVMTAFEIRWGDKKVGRAITTSVSFRLIEPRELDAYVASEEWQGKAGGYAIQGIAAAFCTDLRGSLTSVVGLPLAEVIADLRALGALPHFPPARFGSTT